MSTRIQELLKQVNLSAYDDVDSTYIAHISELEKFAQLIVQECQYAILSRTDLPKHERKLYNNVLKEHFGVKSE